MRIVALLLCVGCGRVAFEELDAIPIPTCGTPVGHDEDLDQIDDGCDVCPHVANPGQRDGDGDRVGDDCDPNPTLPTERITFFDPFTSQRPEWTFVFATPVYTGDSIALDLRNGSLYALKDDATMGDTYQLGGTISQPGTTVARGVVVQAYEGSRGYNCELYDDGTRSFFALTYTPDNVMFSHLVETPAPPLVTGAFTVALRQALPDATCTTTWPADSPAITAAIPGGVIAPDHLGIGVGGAIVTIDYFIQIHSD